MYIQRYATYNLPRFENPDDYKDELKKHTNFYLRRSNKFIMLSLLGAHKCMKDVSYPEEVPVYLATESGNIEDTEVVLAQIYHKKAFPKPINFINTMSNVASFYVAQSLNIVGRNIMVSSKNLSFERALELLKAEFLTGTAACGLVGSVDTAVFTNELFEKKFRRPASKYRLVESSSWFYITGDSENALARIDTIKSCKDRDSAEAWIREQSFGENTVYSMGVFIDDAEQEQWRSIFPNHWEYDYISGIGYNDSITASGVASFIKGNIAQRLVNINKDYQGRYVIMVVVKL